MKVYKIKWHLGSQRFKRLQSTNLAFICYSVVVSDYLARLNDMGGKVIVSPQLEHFSCVYA